MATITNQRSGAAFDCAEGDTILRAALRAGLGMPYSCNTGSCGNCRFDLVEGEVRHLRADPPAWGDRDLKRNRWLGCQAVTLGDCQVKFRELPQYVPPVMPVRRSARLAGVEEITRDISEFSVEVEGELAFRPGQYALFHMPGVEGPRVYSMSNLASDGVWKFLIKRVPDGSGTGWLFGAETRVELALDGPYGTAFLREESPRDIVLLAGGSGLSPMVSIAKGAVAGGMANKRTIRLFYGGRDVPDLYDPAHLGAAGQHVDFFAALSEPSDAWDGPTGLLHDVVAEEMGEALKDCEIYFAGPAVMSAAVQKMAYEAGVPQDQLHFDEFY